VPRDIVHSEARDRLIHRTLVMISVSDMFAAELAKLERQHLESEARTKATLERIKATIKELESLEIPLD